MNESDNRRKMPVLRKDEKQDHRYSYGEWLSKAPTGMPLLWEQMEHS